MNEQTQPLDILLYAHDGRGLGHVSRSVAIGLALRRLAPQLRVLLVTGCRQTGELIGPGPLDWLKLPAYETTVVAGRAQGVMGKSGFGDKQLAALRKEQLAQIVALFRPRLVLVDHQPQGKHRELLPAIAASCEYGCRWVLGVRGVVGEVSQARNSFGEELFQRYYSSLLWYGDRAVLGAEHMARLAHHYGCQPVECGYVSRLAEYRRWLPDDVSGGDCLQGTISVPWLGPGSNVFLKHLAAAIAALPTGGGWHIFLDQASAAGREAALGFAHLPQCQIFTPGTQYAHSLARSKTAVIYGGYNSLVDVVSLGIRSLVVLRPMRDFEQQLHLARLEPRLGRHLICGEEAEWTGSSLQEHLRQLLAAGQVAEPPAIACDGALRAARELLGVLAA